MLKTSEDLRNLRLTNQRLVNPDFKNVVDVVRWFGAVQAQDYAPSLWSISQRLNHKSNISELEEVVNNVEIVRTWPMRGTIHFVLAENARWMLKLLAPRIIRKMQSYYRKSELTESIFKKSAKIIEESLKGKKILTRPELYKILANEKINTKETRGLFILGYLAMEGLICFGPKKANQPTFILVDDWIKNSRELEGDEAIIEMAKLYFQSHGPATVKDFMWWSGLTMKEAHVGIERNKSRFKSEEVNDKRYYFVDSKTIVEKEKAFLLSAYDEYVVAYKDRSDLTFDKSNNILFTVDGFWNTMIFDGMVVGMWRRELKKDKINFQFAPIVKLSTLQKDLFEKEANKYASFFNMDSEISFKR